MQPRSALERRRARRACSGTEQQLRHPAVLHRRRPWHPGVSRAGAPHCAPALTSPPLLFPPLPRQRADAGPHRLSHVHRRRHHVAHLGQGHRLSRVDSPGLARRRPPPARLTGPPHGRTRRLWLLADRGGFARPRPTLLGATPAVVGSHSPLYAPQASSPHHAAHAARCGRLRGRQRQATRASTPPAPAVTVPGGSALPPTVGCD